MDSTGTDGSSEAPAPARAPERIVVCGLGDVGRRTAELLKGFGAHVVGVDIAAETAGAGEAFDEIVAGDCAGTEILRRAGAESARAILLVTADERSNIAAAFAARSLNPGVRLVIRSAQAQLNRLLADQLGNLVAFEPSEFSAPAFAVAALDDETKARFDLDGSTVRVISRKVRRGDWGDGRRPSELNTLHSRVIAHVSAGEILGDLLTLRSADAEIRPGDELTTVECGELLRDLKNPRAEPPKPERPRWSAPLEQARAWLRAAPVVLLVSFAVVFASFVLGVLLYKSENPDISWFDAINVSTVLAVGGFDNVFGALKAPFPISPGLYVYSVLMKIGSAIFLGIIIATMTERVLGARFQIAARRPPAPAAGHSIVVGLAPLGQNIAALLQRWGRPTVGVADQPVGEDVLRGLPVKTGPMAEALARANIAGARSVAVVGDDQVRNLETALLAHSLNPRCALVFRAADRELAKSVAKLIPEATGVSEAEIAAQAIAGAAFDENIFTAFRLLGRSVLVTEYEVAQNPILLDLQLAQLAYGFGAIPILHERDGAGQLNPSDDTRLETNDKVVVLATVAALRRIERGERAAPDCRLLIDSALSAESAFEAGNVIARIAGCDLSVARKALADLPSELGARIYRQQGLRLVRELGKIKVRARIADL